LSERNIVQLVHRYRVEQELSSCQDSASTPGPNRWQGCRGLGDQLSGRARAGEIGALDDPEMQRALYWLSIWP